MRTRWLADGRGLRGAMAAPGNGVQKLQDRIALRKRCARSNAAVGLKRRSANPAAKRVDASGIFFLFHRHVGMARHAAVQSTVAVREKS